MSTSFFVQPRPRKDLLVPPPKKRKTVHKIEEIAYDPTAREEYLSGFHKRKQARIKEAVQIAEKKVKEEKIAIRKQIREDRKREVEDHVQHIHELLRASQSAGIEDIGKESDEEWDGLSEEEAVVEEPIDHEEEYIDEERHTVVTVEAVSVDREGLYKPHVASDNEDEDKEDTEPKEDTDKKKKWPDKVKKKKFRYENKLDRRITERKQQNKRRDNKS